MRINSINAAQSSIYNNKNSKQIKNHQQPTFGYFGNPNIGGSGNWQGPTEFDEAVGEFLGKTFLVITAPVWGPFYGGYKLYEKQRAKNEARIEKLASEKANQMFKAEENRQKTPEELLANFIGASIISDPNKGLNKVMCNGDLKLDVHTEILSPMVAVMKGDKDLVNTNSLPNGFILFGPKGTGKTYFMESLGEQAQELGMDFVVPEIDTLEPLQTAKNIRDAFKSAERNFKDTGKYTLIFMDEMDAYTTDRRLSLDNLKEVAALLKLTENSSQRGVIWLGATNNIKVMDRALLDRASMIRPIPIMQNYELFDTLAYHLIKEKGLNDASNIDYEKIKNKLESTTLKYSPRDMENIAKQAVKFYKINNNNITADDIIDIMSKRIPPKTNERALNEYNNDIVYAKSEGYICEDDPIAQNEE